MEDKRYNGWANYATWKVNLEYFDGDLDGIFDLSPDEFAGAYHLGKELESYVHNLLDESGAPEYVLDLARSFLSDVDWREIAEHMIEDAELEIEE
jgi:hypothetical protein